MGIQVLPAGTAAHLEDGLLREISRLMQIGVGYAMLFDVKNDNASGMEMMRWIIPIRMPSDDMFFQNMYHLPHRDWKWGLKRGVLFDALLGLYLFLHEECIPEKDTHLRDTWMKIILPVSVWNLPGR